MGGNATIHKCVRTNNNIVTHSNLSNNSCINADTYTVSNYRSALPGTSAFNSNGYPFMDITILSQNCVTINSYVVKMAYI